MPHIKPFCGIRPAQEYVERVIAAPPDLPLNEAAVTRLQRNPQSFLHLVAPPLDNEFLQGSRDAIVYRQAAENLQAFLESRILLKEEAPCLYLYSVESSGKLQTGIWTVTLFDDYLNNHLRKHEYTRSERENSIADYLRQTGIDANPILIAYQAQEGRTQDEIDRLIGKYLRQAPVLAFDRGGERHALHRIAAPGDIAALVAFFEELPAAYLADGHHRAAALASYGVERRKFNFKHTGKEEYNFFSSIYFSADSLKIKAFNRLVNDLNDLKASVFLEKLSLDFRVEECGGPPAPCAGRLGMYLPGQWYMLLPLDANRAKRGMETGNPVTALDVTLLQEYILAPLLGINDPRTNERLRFSGGDVSVESLAREVDSGIAAVLFSLYPTTIRQLMAVADAGLVMPPKSTWFEPKLDLGIQTHYID